jgi:hypothetical protein
LGLIEPVTVEARSARRRPRILRVVSRCATIDDFVAAFERFSDGETLFISTAEPRPVGARQPMSITLMDGSPVLQGISEVVETYSPGAGPGGRPGMRIRFLNLNARGEAVMSQLAGTKPERPLPLPPRPPNFATSGPSAEPSVVEDNWADAMDQDETNAKPVPWLAQVGERQLVLPANPLSALPDESLIGFIECTLYEDGTEVDPWEAPPTIRRLEPPLPAPAQSEVRPLPRPPAPDAGVGTYVRRHGDTGKVPRVRSRSVRNSVLVVLFAAIVGGVGGYVVRSEAPWASAREGGHQAGPTGRLRSTTAVAAAGVGAGTRQAGGAAGRGADVAPSAADTSASAAGGDGGGAAGEQVRDESAAGTAQDEAGAPIDPGPDAVGDAPAVVDDGDDDGDDGGDDDDGPDRQGSSSDGTPAGDSGGSALLSGSGCSVRLESAPRRAQVFVGTTDVGRVPLIREMGCGLLTVTFVHARYERMTRKVELRPGEQVTVNVRMRRPVHRIRVTSVPSGAEVSLGPRVVGKTPLVTKVMGYESTQLRVAKKGYKTWRRSIYSRDAWERIDAKLVPER